MAPSPTGRFHLGSARTALYNYLFARKTGGKFILRIEDTDQKRYVPGTEEEIIQSLNWLGIAPDEGPVHGGAYGPYRQTERSEIYRTHAWELVDKGAAFPCFCTPERLEKDHQRDMDLRAAGYTVLRYTWQQVTQRPEQIAAELRLRL